jgi:hypothetical protein
LGSLVGWKRPPAIANDSTICRKAEQTGDGKPHHLADSAEVLYPLAMTDKLLIIDFGSQVTQLIARRLRELNVYCEIHPFQNVTTHSSRSSRPRR